MYSSIIQKGLSKETSANTFQIIQTIPSLKKSNISNTESLNNACFQCAKSILNDFPQEARNQKAISKLFAHIRDKRIHSLTNFSPSAIKSQYHSIRSRGLNSLGQTVFLWANISTQKNPSILKDTILNSVITYVCSDTEALKLIDLPEGIEHSPGIIGMKDNIRGDLIFFDNATLCVTVVTWKSDDWVQRIY